MNSDVLVLFLRNWPPSILFWFLLGLYLVLYQINWYLLYMPPIEIMHLVLLLWLVRQQRMVRSTCCSFKNLCLVTLCLALGWLHCSMLMEIYQWFWLINQYSNSHKLYWQLESFLPSIRVKINSLKQNLI